MRIGIVGTGRIGAFHASTLNGLDRVEQVVVTDSQTQLARQLADDHGYGFSPDLATMLASGIDGLVIASPTASHSKHLRAAIAVGIPTFCEKPLAYALVENIELVDLVTRSGVAVQVGFHRRFDTGYQAAAAAVASGELGFVHSIRAYTHDQAPPPAAYLPTSGGLFRDCNIHDFDILRYVTGREVATVYAAGANKGDPYFTGAGDIDTGAAVLTLDDATLVLVSSTRYNGAGHDVRLEVAGAQGTIAVGLDHSLALRSAEPDVDFPRGPQKWSFMERFQPAYQAELSAFTQVVAGEIPSPCTVSDALQAFRVAEACALSLGTRVPVMLSNLPGGPA